MDDPKVDLEGQGHRSKVKVTRSKKVISGTSQGVHAVQGPLDAWEGPKKLLLAKVKNASSRIGIFLLLFCG